MKYLRKVSNFAHSSIAQLEKLSPPQGKNIISPTHDAISIRINPSVRKGKQSNKQTLKRKNNKQPEKQANKVGQHKRRKEDK